jgi:triphosphoribosyl-dephospho-CoA synthetase
VRLFRRVALAVLLVSLVPDAMMLFSGYMPGATVAGVFTLMVEHVVSWAVAVGVLTGYVGEKDGDLRG